MSQLNESLIRDIVSDVLSQLSTSQGAPKATCACGKAECTCNKNPGSCGCSGKGTSNGKFGVFQTAEEAAAAAADAFVALRKQGFEGRAKVVKIIKTICADKSVEWGKLEFAETKIGRLEHKIGKLEGIAGIPGTEWIQPFGMSGDRGITMEEHTPFGVIGAITPVTHSIPTIACNIINMVAAGNTVVFNAHPGGARCAAEAVRTFNQAIEREVGIPNIVTIIEEPTIESFNDICKNEHIALMCVTGGPAVVDAAMKSGKRSICAGPGNPPVVVDTTAKLDQAAEDIVFGGGFDNNLLCIGEKQVFVVDAIYDRFIQSFETAGARKLNSSQLATLTSEVFTFREGDGGCSHAVLNRELIGADPSVLAQRAGLSVPANTPMLYAETDADHLFVIEEQMTPMLPIIRVRDVHEGIALAKVSEHGYKHSSMIHTLNVEHMTEMAKALDSTLFIKNGHCLAGLGNGGEGYGSFSIATTTGEGITTPMTFTRKRRCVMVNNLNQF
ncbi:MAG: aldehyde dehydrogenase [Kiritimatiellia bacterium]|jgi:aldehyde dehydrogenase